jgi:hypothetical protein
MYSGYIEASWRDDGVLKERVTDSNQDSWLPRPVYGMEIPDPSLPQIGIPCGRSRLHRIWSFGKCGLASHCRAIKLLPMPMQDAPTDSIEPYTFKSHAVDFHELCKSLGCDNVVVGAHDW